MTMTVLCAPFHPIFDATSDEGTSKGGPMIFKHEPYLVRWVEKEEFQKCRLGPRYEGEGVTA
jgi:hypothetical protein